MAELYSFGQHGFKTSFGLLRYYTNSDGKLRTDRAININESTVKPEKGYKFINEFQTNKNKNTHLVTVYSHYIENYIFARPIAVIGTIRGPMPVFIFDQADALFIGSDYSWKRDWSKQLSGIGGFSYLWSRNINKKEALINQPPISVSYKLTWAHQKLWKFKSSKLSIRPSYTFQQFQAPRTISPEDLIDRSTVINSNSEIFDFIDAPKGYFLLDATWSFKRKNISASITVKNLLNTSYRDYLNEMRYFADEPGRNILFTVNYLFKSKKEGKLK
jgi:iron complex outermembrane receptor protein